MHALGLLKKKITEFLWEQCQAIPRKTMFSKHNEGSTYYWPALEFFPGHANIRVFVYKKQRNIRNNIYIWHLPSPIPSDSHQKGQELILVVTILKKKKKIVT